MNSGFFASTIHVVEQNTPMEQMKSNSIMILGSNNGIDFIQSSTNSNLMSLQSNYVVSVPKMNLSEAMYFGTSSNNISISPTGMILDSSIQNAPKSFQLLTISSNNIQNPTFLQGVDSNFFMTVEMFSPSTLGVTPVQSSNFINILLAKYDFNKLQWYIPDTIVVDGYDDWQNTSGNGFYNSITYPTQDGGIIMAYQVNYLNIYDPPPTFKIKDNATTHIYPFNFRDSTEWGNGYPNGSFINVIILVKYDSEGFLEWIATLDSDITDISAISDDLDGNIYISVKNMLDYIRVVDSTDTSYITSTLFSYGAGAVFQFTSSGSFLRRVHIYNFLGNGDTPLVKSKKASYPCKHGCFHNHIMFIYNYDSGFYNNDTYFFGEGNDADFYNTYIIPADINSFYQFNILRYFFIKYSNILAIEWKAYLDLKVDFSMDEYSISGIVASEMFEHDDGSVTILCIINTYDCYLVDSAETKTEITIPDATNPWNLVIRLNSLGVYQWHNFYGNALTNLNICAYNFGVDSTNNMYITSKGANSTDIKKYNSNGILLETYASLPKLKANAGIYANSSIYDYNNDYFGLSGFLVDNTPIFVCIPNTTNSLDVGDIDPITRGIGLYTQLPDFSFSTGFDNFAVKNEDNTLKITPTSIQFTSSNNKSFKLPHMSNFSADTLAMKDKLLFTSSNKNMILSTDGLFINSNVEKVTKAIQLLDIDSHDIVNPRFVMGIDNNVYMTVENYSPCTLGGIYLESTNSVNLLLAKFKDGKLQWHIPDTITIPGYDDWQDYPNWISFTHPTRDGGVIVTYQAYVVPNSISVINIQDRTGTHSHTFTFRDPSNYYDSYSQYYDKGISIVVKYNADGIFQWVATLDNDSLQIQTITDDADGNVYISIFNEYEYVRVVDSNGTESIANTTYYYYPEIGIFKFTSSGAFVKRVHYLSYQAADYSIAKNMKALHPCNQGCFHNQILYIYNVFGNTTYFFGDNNDVTPDVAFPFDPALCVDTIEPDPTTFGQYNIIRYHFIKYSNTLAIEWKAYLDLKDVAFAEVYYNTGNMVTEMFEHDDGSFTIFCTVKNFDGYLIDGAQNKIDIYIPDTINSWNLLIRLDSTGVYQWHKFCGTAFKNLNICAYNFGVDSTNTIYVNSKGANSIEYKKYDYNGNFIETYASFPTLTEDAYTHMEFLTYQYNFDYFGLSGFLTDDTPIFVFIPNTTNSITINNNEINRGLGMYGPVIPSDLSLKSFDSFNVKNQTSSLSITPTSIKFTSTADKQLQLPLMSNLSAETFKLNNQILFTDSNTSMTVSPHGLVVDSNIPSTFVDIPYQLLSMDDVSSISDFNSIFLQGTGSNFFCDLVNYGLNSPTVFNGITIDVSLYGYQSLLSKFNGNSLEWKLHNEFYMQGANQQNVLNILLPTLDGGVVKSYHTWYDYSRLSSDITIRDTSGAHKFNFSMRDPSDWHDINNLTGSYLRVCVLIKYDSQGVYQWHTTVDSTEFLIQSLIEDVNGNIYLSVSPFPYGYICEYVRVVDSSSTEFIRPTNMQFFEIGIFQFNAAGQFQRRVNYIDARSETSVPLYKSRKALHQCKEGGCFNNQILYIYNNDNSGVNDTYFFDESQDIIPGTDITDPTLRVDIIEADSNTFGLYNIIRHMIIKYSDTLVIQWKAYIDFQNNDPVYYLVNGNRVTEIYQHDDGTITVLAIVGYGDGYFVDSANTKTTITMPGYSASYNLLIRLSNTGVYQWHIFCGIALENSNTGVYNLIVDSQNNMYISSNETTKINVTKYAYNGDFIEVYYMFPLLSQNSSSLDAYRHLYNYDNFGFAGMLSDNPLIVINPNSTYPITIDSVSMNSGMVLYGRLGLGYSLSSSYPNFVVQNGANKLTITPTSIGLDSTQNKKLTLSDFRVEGSAFINTLTVNTAYVGLLTPSDIRLKSDLSKIIDPLEKVNQLSGYTFNMNKQRKAGLIAQDVQKILPEATMPMEDSQYLAVDYNGVIAVLVESIKSLSAQVEILNAKVFES